MSSNLLGLKWRELRSRISEWVTQVGSVTCGNLLLLLASIRTGSLLLGYKFASRVVVGLHVEKFKLDPSSFATMLIAFWNPKSRSRYFSPAARMPLGQPQRCACSIS